MITHIKPIQYMRKNKIDHLLNVRCVLNMLLGASLVYLVLIAVL